MNQCTTLDFLEKMFPDNILNHLVTLLENGVPLPGVVAAATEAAGLMMPLFESRSSTVDRADTRAFAAQEALKRHQLATFQTAHPVNPTGQRR